MTRNKAIPVGMQPIHTSRKTNEMIHMTHNFQQKENFYQKSEHNSQSKSTFE